MAIGARTAPEVVVIGPVQGTRVKKWEGERTGTSVEVGTEGGPLVVGYRVANDRDVPGVGEVIAVWASAFDGERGSSLTYERPLSPGDVDELHSLIGAAKA